MKRRTMKKWSGKKVSRWAWIRRIGQHNIYSIISNGRAGLIPRNSCKQQKTEYMPLFCLRCDKRLPNDYGFHFCEFPDAGTK